MSKGSTCPECSSERIRVHDSNMYFICQECGWHFDLTVDFYKQIWDKTNGKCIYCGVQLMDVEESRQPRFNRARYRFTVDHFVPKKLGGTNKIQNLVPSCGGCNNRKRNMLPQNYLAERAKGTWLEADRFAQFVKSAKRRSESR